MSLKDRFARPGPGVEKDAPRKKGLARFIEILSRDIRSLLLVGLVTTLGFVPLILGALLTLDASSMLLALPAGLIGGAIAGPFLCALYDAILRMLRDEPAFWWHTYKKALAQDWKASLLPGALMGLMTVSLLFLALSNAITVQPILIAGLISLLIGSLILPLWFAQIALMDLPAGAILKNALLMAFGCAPRTLPAAAVQIVYWVFLIANLPWTLLWLPLFGLWVIALVTLQILYPALDKSFGIEEKIRAKREAELQQFTQDRLSD